MFSIFSIPRIIHVKFLLTAILFCLYTHPLHLFNFACEITLFEHVTSKLEAILILKHKKTNIKHQRSTICWLYFSSFIRFSCVFFFKKKKYWPYKNNKRQKRKLSCTHIHFIPSSFVNTH